MSIEELANLGVSELVGAYATRRLSPVEVLKTTLEQAERVNPAINALFCLRSETAMAVARASEARWKERTPLGLLDGVPISVADSIAIAGLPRPCGVKANQNLPASTCDAPAARALRESGASIFAKTTMPDCGLLASGVSSMHGVTRNPWGLAWNTGGPSAGAGATLAAGVGHLAVGVDIAGSVQMAAAHCGLAALKPTQGHALHLPADTMPTAGAMGRSVEDIARLLTVLAQPDERGARSSRLNATRYHERLGCDIKGRRIGVLIDMGFGLRPEMVVGDAVEAAAKALAGAGAIVAPFVSPFDFDAYAPLGQFLQVRGLVEISALPSHGEGDVHPSLFDWAVEGACHRATDLYVALERISHVGALLLAAFEPYDYVIAPVSPIVSFPAELPAPKRATPLAHTNFTALFDLTGQPAATVCFGFDERRLPIGVQVIGRCGDDLGVLQIARALEDMRGTKMSWPLTPRS